MKYAIINADDFGLSDSINKAIIQSFKEGILKSASLLINSKKTQEAVELAKKNPQLDLGIHLCLVQGSPVSKHKNIYSLLGSNGYFLKNHFDFLIKLWSGRINLYEVELEFNEQIKKALEYNLNITHIDTHQHIHLYPSILKILVRLAKKFGIPWIRYPAQAHWPALATFGDTRGISKFILINTYKHRIKNILKKNNILYPNYIIGMYNAGTLNNVVLKKMLSLMRGDDITEIIFHPAIKNENFSKEFPGSFKNLNWEKEFRVLMEPSLRDFAINAHIEFVSFRDIIQNKQVKHDKIFCNCTCLQ